jgi:glucokinase
MSDAPLFVGLDVGGTTMKAGVLDDSGRVLGTAVVPTEPHLGQEHGLAQMVKAVHAANAAAGLPLDRIVAIGVATPGPLDIAAGVIYESPNLPGWRDVPVRDHIARTFARPTAFQNDANAAAVGELWAGAGAEARSMVLFTLGTGVGGGVVLGDTVLEGANSHGGELGHVKIAFENGRLCGCGKRGCLEAYASATAVVKRAREALAAGEPSTLRDSDDLEARDVFTAAAGGDALAARLVEETAFYLAVGAVSVMHTVDPEMVVYGGGMTAAGPAFLDRIRHHIREHAFPVPAARTKVRYARLGSDAGFIGAAACGRNLWLRERGKGAT